MIEQGVGPTGQSDSTPAGRFSGLTRAPETFPASGAHLFFANREIDRVDVDNVALDRCVFFNFGLKQVTFRGGRLSHCVFERTSLRHAKFRGVPIRTGSVGDVVR